MALRTSASTSLKEYLKKYESNVEEDKKKKKKKKTKTLAKGVLVVDEDPVWQKPLNLDEEEENDSPDEKPIIHEDIEVKRMRRLEQLRARRSYNQISEDGSGWVSVGDAPLLSASVDLSSDMSPPRHRVVRYDTPSQDPEMRPSDSGREDTDPSPPRQRRRNDSPSPEPGHRRKDSGKEDIDISPPRQRRRRNDSPSPEPEDTEDLSPPRRKGRSHDSSSIPGKNPSILGVKDTDLDDLPPPRKRMEKHLEVDLSPPRKRMEKHLEVDLSPPRKRKEHQKTGLITGKDVSEEIAKTKKEEFSRFNEMDPSASGRGAEPVYRIRGERVSKEEYLKLTRKEDKPKGEKKLEWGRGLAQKREADAKVLELELEKNKPFARSRDDSDLDTMLKERVRWGDPMAHLVKKKQHDSLLPDLGANEKMHESGFIVPQEIPSHSWITRRLDFEPNRYGIQPGRHWDGVNRSNGYEKQMFKRASEKRATEREAYLWSVSDM